MHPHLRNGLYGEAVAILDVSKSEPASVYLPNCACAMVASSSIASRKRKFLLRKFFPSAASLRLRQSTERETKITTQKRVGSPKNKNNAKKQFLKSSPHQKKARIGSSSSSPFVFFLCIRIRIRMSPQGVLDHLCAILHVVPLGIVDLSHRGKNSQALKLHPTNSTRNFLPRNSENIPWKIKILNLQ